ncbi:hypothetical protein BRM94_08805, partial [Xanthomonas oryzae pv. oryzae]
MSEHAMVLAVQARSEVAFGQGRQQLGAFAQVAVADVHQRIEVVDHARRIVLEARCIAAPADIAIGCSLRQSFDLGVADSTLIRNAVEDLLGEDFEGRFESK